MLLANENTDFWYLNRQRSSQMLTVEINPWSLIMPQLAFLYRYNFSINWMFIFNLKTCGINVEMKLLDSVRYVGTGFEELVVAICSVS